MKYKERILKSEDQFQQEDVEILNNRAKLNIKTFLLNSETELMEAEALLKSLKDRREFSTDEIFNIHNKVQLATRKVKFAEDLKKELF